MINVSKTYLPPLEEYYSYLEEIWKSGWVTNNGQLIQTLESELQEYLMSPEVYCCSNGTIAMQLAIKSLDLHGEIITTPFSYVATTNVLIWEGLNPIFVDINISNFCIDADQIEKSITEKTTGILATHVYGNACDIEKIDQIAKDYNLRVIYDGAHAFGVKVNEQSIFNYGDVSTCSFHATKLFHTIEGGAVFTNNQDLQRKLYLLRQFGHHFDDYVHPGINAKNSELHAAIGLCNLKVLDELIKERKFLSEFYIKKLDSKLQTLTADDSSQTQNYSYMPVLFPSEEVLLSAYTALKSNDIFPRRYFYPSLNTLKYIYPKQICPISEDYSRRVLCLPLYNGLTEDEVASIIDIVNKNVKQ